LVTNNARIAPQNPCPRPPRTPFQDRACRLPPSLPDRKCVRCFSRGEIPENWTRHTGISPEKEPNRCEFRLCHAEIRIPVPNFLPFHLEHIFCRGERSPSPWCLKKRGGLWGILRFLVPRIPSVGERWARTGVLRCNTRIIGDQTPVPTFVRFFPQIPTHVPPHLLEPMAKPLSLRASVSFPKLPHYVPPHLLVSMEETPALRGRLFSPNTYP
jgi:hypothetical protein